MSEQTTGEIKVYNEPSLEEQFQQIESLSIADQPSFAIDLVEQILIGKIDDLLNHPNGKAIDRPLWPTPTDNGQYKAGLPQEDGVVY